ncbi:MAG: hypothetical protein Q8S19_00200 [Bacillota bacterium]|nr:hypothetical protein [Bacillota bacterium]
MDGAWRVARGAVEVVPSSQFLVERTRYTVHGTRWNRTSYFVGIVGHVALAGGSPHF